VGRGKSLLTNSGMLWITPDVLFLPACARNKNDCEAFTACPLY